MDVSPAVPPACVVCHRTRTPDEDSPALARQRPWRHFAPVCRHGGYDVCPDCSSGPAAIVTCPVCGCDLLFVE